MSDKINFDPLRLPAKAEGKTKLSDPFDQDPVDDSPDKREIAVALHYDEEKDGGRHIAIPTGWVKKITYLKEDYKEVTNEHG